MIRTLRTRAAVVVLAGALLGAACSGDDTSGDSDRGAPDAEAVLTALADDVIIPTYEALVEALAALQISVGDLCADPSAQALESARASWHAVQLAWGHSRAVMVGPATELRLMGDVGYRARVDDVEELAVGTDPVDPVSLDGEGTAVRGIFAVEQLLFAPTADSLATGEGAHRCQYAAAAIALSSTATVAVLGEWRPDPAYRSTFINGPDGDPQMSVSTLVNDASFRLQEVDDLGLRDLIGAASVDDLTEARRDGASASRVAYLRAVLDGAVAVLNGVDGPGIRDLLAERSADTADRLGEAIDDAVAALADLPDSIAATLADQAAVTAAADAVAALKVLVGTEVASQLGVTIGFSDADGDS